MWHSVQIKQSSNVCERVCGPCVVSKFARPYLLTYNTGCTDYINAVFIDVSHFPTVSCYQHC